MILKKSSIYLLVIMITPLTYVQGLQQRLQELSEHIIRLHQSLTTLHINLQNLQKALVPRIKAQEVFEHVKMDNYNQNDLDSFSQYVEDLYNGKTPQQLSD